MFCHRLCLSFWLSFNLCFGFVLKVRLVSLHNIWHWSFFVWFYLEDFLHGTGVYVYTHMCRCILFLLPPFPLRSCSFLIWQHFVLQAPCYISKSSEQANPKGLQTKKSPVVAPEEVRKQTGVSKACAIHAGGLSDWPPKADPTPCFNCSRISVTGSPWEWSSSELPALFSHAASYV